MTYFWFEYLYFIAAILAILVSTSAAILFFTTRKTEKSTKTSWRAYGFLSLSLAFFLYILVSKSENFILVAILAELAALSMILRGLWEEPFLAHLKAVKSKTTVPKLIDRSKLYSRKGLIKLLILGFVSFGVLGGLVLGYSQITEDLSFGQYISPALTLISVVFILATAFLQFQRFRKESKDKEKKRQNLFPLLGYIALLVRNVLLLLVRLSDTEAVSIEGINSVSINLGRASTIFTLIAFLFLARWAWYYIKPRTALRIYVSFFTIAIIISSIGSFLFTLLIFNIVEQNNYELMSEGAYAQFLVMEDKSNTALILAKSMAQEDCLVDNISSFGYYNTYEDTEEQVLTSGIDILRIYDTQGQVVLSPSDERERGQFFDDDVNLQKAINGNQAIKSFDTEPHVLSSIIVVRGLYPITCNDSLNGVVEIGYKLDNAFVDFSQDRTDLDVTMFTDETRSATTLYKLDGVSRWVGTKMTDANVLVNVLEEGEAYSHTSNNLGEEYYSAYLPIHNYSGEIIGMLAVESPTYELFEKSRQQLINVFLVLALMSILAAGLGYYSLQSGRFKVNLRKLTPKAGLGRLRKKVKTDIKREQFKRKKGSVFKPKE